MEWYWIISFVGVGLVAGLLSGLLGISGGVITVPSLLFLFRQIGLPADSLMHIAVGTSLSSMAFNSFSSMMTHRRRQSIIWEAVLKMAPGLMLGAVGGAFLAGNLGSGFLQIFFGCFECVIGIYFLFPVRPREDLHPLPSWLALSGAALFISGLATILGIGGGLMVTPLLIWFGFRMRKAVGTSSACSFAVCASGAISYLIIGLQSGEVIEDTIGYVHFPSFLTMVLTAPFAAILGAQLHHVLPVRVMRSVFGVALVLAGLALIF